MKHYLLALGGSGGKLLESLVWAAAADTLTDESGHSLDELAVLVADMDDACGNIHRALQAAASYEQVRKLLSSLPCGHRGFHTTLRVSSWDVIREHGTSAAKQMTDSPDDHLLTETLFDASTLAALDSPSLQGNAEIGALLFSNALQRPGDKDAFLAMAAEIDEALSAHEAVKVLLCSSCFGGTGAAGVDVISRALHARFASQSELFELGALLLLPCSRLPDQTGWETIALDRARSTLAYWGVTGLLRDGLTDKVGRCDAVYLMGMPYGCFVTEASAGGSEGQMNDAHLTEWLAARCAAHFLHTDFRGEEGRHISGYCCRIDSHRFGWEGFDQDADVYRRAYGGLLMIAALYCCEVEPVLRVRMTSPRRRRDRTINYWAAYFHDARKLSADARSAMLRDADSLGDCLRSYAGWMLQIIRSLPPQLRCADALETARTAASQNYLLLAAAAGRVKLLEQELNRLRARQVEVVHRTEIKDDAADRVSRTLAEAQEELRGLQRRQRPLDRRIGGQAKMEIIAAADAQISEQLSNIGARVTELRQRLAREKDKPGDARNVTAMRADTEALRRQERQFTALEGQRAQCAADAQAAVEARLNALPPELTQDELTLPGSDLFDPSALLLLEQVLREHREGAVKPATAKAMEHALQQLVRSPAKAHITAGEIFDRLGDGAGSSKGVSPLACLFAQLLEIVTEEGRK